MPSSLDPRRALARSLLPLLDLTSLGEDDTPAQIDELCAAALRSPILPAAICVYPEHVSTVRRFARESKLKVATVVNFPDGGADPDRVSRETRRAIAAGADEIDMVLPYRALIAGNVIAAQLAVQACRAACGAGIMLKLILETGELGSPELIASACRIGFDAGVDFLKTSTGKVPVNASLEAADMMLTAIAGQGGKCGLKVAGGIRTIEGASRYLSLVQLRMGADWANPDHFRIGASALFTELSSALSEPA